MFSAYTGYPNGYLDVVDFTEPDEDGKFSSWVKAPNVLRVVREHLGCDTLKGAELEDDGGEWIAAAHWERRLFQVGVHRKIRHHMPGFVV
jgi:hypothetical protein